MSTKNNVTFESNQLEYDSRSTLAQTKTSSMTRFLIIKGMVKNEKQAQGVLLTTTVLFLIASVYIFFVFVFDINLFDKTPKQTQEQILFREERLIKIKQENSINLTGNKN